MLPEVGYVTLRNQANKEVGSYYKIKVGPTTTPGYPQSIQLPLYDIHYNVVEGSYGNQDYFSHVTPIQEIRNISTVTVIRSKEKLIPFESNAIVGQEKVRYKFSTSKYNTIRCINGEVFLGNTFKIATVPATANQNWEIYIPTGYGTGYSFVTPLIVQYPGGFMAVTYIGQPTDGNSESGTCILFGSNMTDEDSVDIVCAPRSVSIAMTGFGVENKDTGMPTGVFLVSIDEPFNIPDEVITSESGAEFMALFRNSKTWEGNIFSFPVGMRTACSTNNSDFSVGNQVTANVDFDLKELSSRFVVI